MLLHIFISCGTIEKKSDKKRKQKKTNTKANTKVNTNKKTKTKQIREHISLMLNPEGKKVQHVFPVFQFPFQLINTHVSKQSTKKIHDTLYIHKHNNQT